MSSVYASITAVSDNNHVCCLSSLWYCVILHVSETQGSWIQFVMTTMCLAHTTQPLSQRTDWLWQQHTYWEANLVSTKHTATEVVSKLTVAKASLFRLKYTCDGYFAWNYMVVKLLISAFIRLKRLREHFKCNKLARYTSPSWPLRGTGHSVLL